MPSTFNVGQELYVGMEFDSKDAVKNAVKQYVMRVHQSFKVVESKWDKYVVCCLNRNADCPCPFYMRAILSKKTDSWKVTQWGWTTHMSQYDHDPRSREAWFKFNCHLCSRYVFYVHIMLFFSANCHLNFVILLIGMIREDPSIKVSLIQERINNEFVYKVSYKKAWLAKQKAIAIEYDHDTRSRETWFRFNCHLCSRYVFYIHIMLLLR